MNRKLLRIFAQKFVQNEISLRASGISYFLFFALIPMITTLVSLTLIIPFLKSSAEQVLDLLANLLLPQAVMGVKASFMAFTDDAKVICIISAFISVYLLSKIVFFFENSMNLFWSFEQKYSVWRVLKKSLLLYLLGTLGIGVFIVLRHWRNIGIEIFIAWLLFWSFNRIVPAWPKQYYKDLKWWTLLPGSLVCGSVWYISKWLFTFYFEQFSKMNQLTAVLGTIPLFLLWINLSSYMLLLSGSINGILHKMKHEKDIHLE